VNDTAEWHLQSGCRQQCVSSSSKLDIKHAPGLTDMAIGIYCWQTDRNSNTVYRLVFWFPNIFKTSRPIRKSRIGIKGENRRERTLDIAPLNEPHFRSAQLWHALLRISQCYLHTHAFIHARNEPCLSLSFYLKLVLIYRPPEEWKAELAGYISRWFPEQV